MCPPRSMIRQKYHWADRVKTSNTKLLFCGWIFTTQTENGILMGIDPAPFWVNLFLYTYENEYLPELISNDEVKACRFHATKRFIDDLGTLNDAGAFNDVYKDIYSPELQLKVEHSSTHATFLKLYITAKYREFIYKLFDKRDAFPFLIVRMPFYSALVDEFLRIDRSFLLYKEFREEAIKLLNRMKVQGAKSLRCRKT